jgi:N-acetylmuramoyl-L-alanine amidase
MNIQNKQKAYFSVFRISLLLYFFILFISGFDVFAGYNPKKPGTVKTIVIDAGHGGKDPGCNGVKHKESEITLAIALKLGKLVEENLKDVKVIYTRKTDVFIELEERAQIANRNNADLFISIHCNAAAKFIYVKNSKGKKVKKEVTNPIPYGSETYVMGIKNEKGKMEVAKRENSVMLMEDNYEKTYNGFDPNSDEAYIIMSMWTGAFLEQSARFASSIQKEYISKAGRIDKGVQRQSIWVLWRTAMPSVLTEVGFLTNPEEEKFLGSDKGQHYMATALFRALRNYKNEQEGKNLKYDDEFENQPPLQNENLLRGDTLKIQAEELTEEITEEKTDDAETKYKNFVKSAEDKTGEGNFEEAINLYKQALEIKPNDPYAKTKISKLNELILKAKNEDEVNKKYNNRMALADAFFNEKQWEDAKKAYKEALVLKPNETKPKEKIVQIDDFIAIENEAKKKNELYQINYKSAEEFVSAGKHKEALSAIEICLKEIPEDPQAKIKKEEILKLIENDKKVVESKDLIQQYKNTPSHVKNTNENRFEPKNSTKPEGIAFGVQFYTSEKEWPDNDGKFAQCEAVWHYKAGNVFKYVSGKYLRPEDAVNNQSRVRNAGFKDAFAVAFKDGQRIDFKQATALVNN